MEEILISVIIPVRNAGKYLQACLDSVLGQSHRNLEVIAVEDNSTDDSSAILAARAAADPRLRVLQNNATGVSAARNTGIEHAHGEWINFTDADDLLHPEALGTLLSAALRAKAQVAMAGFCMFDETLPAPASIGRTKVRLMHSDDAMIATFYQQKLDSSVWGKLFSAELFDDSLRFRQCRFEDLDIIYRIYDRAHRLAVLQIPLYYYRRHSSSFIQNIDSQGRFDSIDVCERLLNYTQLHSADVKRAAATRTFAACMNALNMLFFHSRHDEELEERCMTHVIRLRSTVLHNSNARRRDRLGALLAFMPHRLMTAILRRRNPMP